jgi:hypothetical protein
MRASMNALIESIIDSLRQCFILTLHMFAAVELKANQAPNGVKKEEIPNE